LGLGRISTVKKVMYVTKQASHMNGIRLLLVMLHDLHKKVVIAGQ
jgi:hypothetical protein